VLSRGDDYPIHQTPEPVAYAGTDRNFYDRYYFDGYAPGFGDDGWFAVAFGVYPHLNIADASFSWLSDGKQVTLHASRCLDMERMALVVGPFRINVEVPLQRLSVHIEAPEQGIRAAFTFTGRSFPVEEPRFTRRMGPRVFMDVTRMTQNGVYAGFIEIDGTRTSLDGFVGTRDRSWGVRPVGAPDAQPPAPLVLPQFYWLWSPCVMDGGDLYFHTNDDEHGRAWNRRAVWRDLGSAQGAEQEYDAADIAVRWKPGRRHAADAALTLRDAAGDTHVAFAVGETFMMLGLGYGHPIWAHGLNHSGDAVAREDFVPGDLDATAREHLHIQSSVGVTMTLPDGTVRRGKGVLEQLAIGPHAPSGFTGLFDAP
jgi:hypothetical protein